MADIREKIRNLFDLASSDNEHEAKAALLKAQELMVKHKLSEKDINLIKKQEVRTINTGLKYSTANNSYILGLTEVIAGNYCCVKYATRNYKAKTREMVIAGLEEDVEICMQVLQKAVQTIMANEKKLTYRKGYTNKEKKIVKSSYEKGFVKGLDEMFRLQKKSNEAEWGLVLVIPEEVKSVTEGMKKSNFRQKNNGYDNDAYLRGKEDGSQFNPERMKSIENSKLAICG